MNMMKDIATNTCKTEGLISVIIPVFNMFDSLEGTLKSVTAQTYSNLEIVCVDDGSTDGSHKVIESWAEKDSRIRIVSRQNGGLSAARNSGLDVASGEYVAFLDAGDVLHEKAFETLLGALISSKADVAVSKSFVKAKSLEVAVKKLSAVMPEKGRFISSDSPLNDILKYKYVLSSTCNKLYRREAISALRFEEGIFFEGWPFVTKVFGGIKRLAIVDAPLYGYIMQPQSITRSDFSEKKVLSYVAGIESVNEYFSQRGGVPRAALKRCGIASGMMLGKVWHSRAAVPELRSLALREFWRLVRERKILLRDVALKATVRAVAMRRFNKIWLLSFGLWILFSFLACHFYPVMMSDSAARYAPMADAFAAGDWRMAFHPRFGVMFQVLSGSVAAMMGIDGDRSLQIVAFGLLSLSLVPIWFLSKRIFGERVAWLSVLLVFFGDDFFRYSLDGLRDSGKCLGFALLGLGVVERKGHWFGIGLFVLISLASYCFAVGMLFLSGWCVYALLRREWRMLLWPAAGAALGTLAVTAMVHAYTGHWLPAPHFIRYLGDWL